MSAVAAPQAPVRTGQQKPFIKGTNQEIQERIEFCATLMSRALTKTQIHKLMRERYGIEWRQIDRYMTRAQQFLAKNSDMSREQARKMGINILLDIFRTGDASERTRAEKRLAEIFGYDAPTQLRVGDVDGKPIAPAVIAPTVNFILPTKEEPRVEVISNGHNGNGNGNGHHLITLPEKNPTPNT